MTLLTLGNHCEGCVEIANVRTAATAQLNIPYVRYEELKGWED